MINNKKRGLFIKKIIEQFVGGVFYNISNIVDRDSYTRGP